MSSKYTFAPSDLEFFCSPEWSSDQSASLVSEIAQVLAKEKPLANIYDRAVPLKAQLSERTEGQSAARVYQLAFSVPGNIAVPYAKFIIRAHGGPEAANVAERERMLVSRIRASGSDYFSSNLIESTYSNPGVVVYRHAEDQLGETSSTLQAAIIEAIRSEDDHRVKIISESLRRFACNLTKVYDQVEQDRKLIDGATYHAAVYHRFAPDLLIEARGRDLQIEGGRINICTEDHEIGNPEKATLFDTTKLFRLLSFDPTRNEKWIRINLWPVATRPHDGYLRFAADGNEDRIWIRVDNVTLELEARCYEVLVKCSNGLILTSNLRLKELGFSAETRLSTPDHARFCKRFDEIRQSVRHADLHCRNVLISSTGLMKAIDLSSTQYDLLAVCQARLEISIWSEVTRVFGDISQEDTERVLDRLWTAGEPARDVGWKAWALNCILRALRCGATEGGGTKPLPPLAEIVLAYTTQVLIAQRYYLEHSTTASAALNTVAGFWLSRFRSGQDIHAADATHPTPPTGPLTAPDGTGDDVHTPTLYALWIEALTSPQLGEVMDGTPRHVIESFCRKEAPLMQRPLTELQTLIWSQCREGNSAFQDVRHVILAGPTSCGKSTVAEMFLAGPSLLNKQRRCALYIAPTRALTQAKHRELKATFAGSHEMAEGLVLSTGEDTDFDWHITHGKFTIACMVYEKANMLFSQGRRLLDHLGCIVVDEIHMLNNLERGPVLELALTKALRERRRIDAEARMGPTKETVRVVAITTEQRPDPTIEAFLSVTDASGTRTMPPLLYHASARPVHVEHTLVLGGNQSEPYTCFPIVNFTSTNDRTLSKERLVNLSKRLSTTWNAIRKSRKLRARETGKQELSTRLNQLLLTLLAQHPKGYRVLVFVPGRKDAEDEASRLKNRLREAAGSVQVAGLAEGVRRDDLLLRLETSLEASEDERLASRVKECAALGIFIHHADVERRIRAVVEDICGEMSEETPSEIIFATETLSYGVNLAINDVVMCGTEFYTQTRFREFRPEHLPVSAFHNMAGRAGRLGKTSGGVAHVYVMIPLWDRDDRDVDPFWTVQDYYTEIQPARSQLYVVDDRKAQIAAEQNRFSLFLPTESDPCAVYRGIKAVEFSYPFVRSVLDALRFLNMSKRATGNVDAVNRVDVEEVLKTVFSNSLYAFQSFDGMDARKERQLFRCAVQRILDNCSEAPLKLVTVEDGATKRYLIRPRGEAIIDTGTELSTVEPLLRIKEWFHQTWSVSYPKTSFPVELYVLCLVAQTELYRQYMHYTPECRSGDLHRSWTKEMVSTNRAFVFDSLKRSLSKIGISSEEQFANQIRAFLEQWDAIQEVNAIYVHGAADSLLRFFNGMIAWMNGEERAIVEALLEGREEGHDLEEVYCGRMQGFRQFTEQLNWKTLFLAKMLTTEELHDGGFRFTDERSLHMLSARLRLGCTTEAIPLFWPKSSDFRRREAVMLLDAGVTPRRILSMNAPHDLVCKTVDIPPHQLQLDRLHSDLEKYAVKEFEELKEEMTSVPAADDKRELIHHLWHEIRRLFPEAIAQFRRFGPGALSFHELLCESLDFAAEDEGEPATCSIMGSAGRGSANEKYRIRIEIHHGEDTGIYWHGERCLEESTAGHLEGTRKANRLFAIQHTVKIIGLQLRKDWSCSRKQGKWEAFADVLKGEQLTPYLAIVVFPWMPAKDEMPVAIKAGLEARASAPDFSTTFVTPAAFATMTSAIVRDFVSGEDFVRIFASVPASGFNTIGISDVQRVTDRGLVALPPSIREKLIQHFEVGF